MAEFEVAVVGGGGISRAHIAAAKTTGGRVSIAAVVDPNENARRAAADAAEAKAFATFEDFLGAPESKTVRGVIVCTPPSVRLAIVESAMARGLHVLAEKPLAHTLADAKWLAEIAAKHPKLTAVVGYCHRFTPAIAEMKKRISDGAIGEVRHFDNAFVAPLPHMQNHWMSDPTISGGGSFIDTGCHSLDLFLHLIGPGTVKAAVFRHAWPGRGESSATVLLHSGRGVPGVIRSSWDEPARFVITVGDTDASFTYDYENATELLFHPRDGAAQNIPVETHEVRFQRQLEAFADAASGKTPAISPATFADGVLTAERVAEAQALAS